MAKMYNFPYYNGIYTSIRLSNDGEEITAYYGIVFNEHCPTTIVGNIGKTACCGSSDVIGIPDISGTTLLELIRVTRTACFRIHYYLGGFENLSESLQFVNAHLKGIAKVENLTELTKHGQIWLSVEVKDEDKMKDFYANH